MNRMYSIILLLALVGGSFAGWERTHPIGYYGNGYDVLQSSIDGFIRCGKAEDVFFLMKIGNWQNLMIFLQKFLEKL